MQAFMHGLVLAVGLILPLGIQNLFVFTQGVNQPRFWGVLPVVITAALCDTILILVAVQGVSLFVSSFAWLKILFIGSGIIFLLYMGWLTWHNKAMSSLDKGEKEFTMKQQIVFSLTVSLFNPHAILDTIGVIGGSSVTYSGSEKIWFTVACIVVSWCWFLLLAILGWRLRRQDGFIGILGIVNKVSAFVMWLSALYMIKQLS